jgi:hypothetical protein
LRKLLLIGLLGLGPLWVAVVWVIAGAGHSVMCVATMIMTFAANYVFHGAGRLRKIIL